MHDLGICVSPSSIHRKKKELVKKQEERINNTVTQYVKEKESDNKPILPPIEVLGDNLDVTITPTRMTSEKQRKSLHWFLVMAKQKRITIDDLDLPLNHQGRNYFL